MIDALDRKFRKLKLPEGIVMGEIKLDAGCGVSVREGYIGLDIYDYGQDIVWDMQGGIPLPDNSCAEIFTQHCLEHIPDMIGVMNEFWRVIKPGGKLTIIVPHKNNFKANIPSHLRIYDEGTFSFFEEGTEFNEKRRHGPEKWIIEETAVNDRPDMIVVMTPLK